MDSIAFGNLNQVEMEKVADKLRKEAKSMTYDMRQKTEDVPYFKLGSGTENGNGDSMNVIREMSLMSKPESWFISYLVDQINYFENYDNRVRVVRKHLTALEIKYLTKGYKGLHQKNIVKRVKNGTYMISPWFLIPFKGFTDATEAWRELR